MCFFIEEKNPNVLIANENIACYKPLFELSDGRIEVPFLETIIILGAEYFTTSKNIVNDGFSSYIYKLTHTQSIELGVYGIPIYECIIPKGAEYMVNESNNEYVSNKIIIKTKVC